jgi:hypothetical protein
MKPERDFTKAKFLERAAAYGWKPAGFMGYFRRELPDGSAVSVSTWNAGDSAPDAACLPDRGGREARA